MGSMELSNQHAGVIWTAESSLTLTGAVVGASVADVTGVDVAGDDTAAQTARVAVTRTCCTKHTHDCPPRDYDNIPCLQSTRLTGCAQCAGLGPISIIVVVTEKFAWPKQ